MPGLSPYFYEERLEHDDDGNLQRIDHIREDGYQHTVYQRPKKGQTFQSIREAGTQKLIQAVVDTLRAANLREKIYSIQLSYKCISHYFPPIIFPVPESYRQALLESEDPEAKFNIFTPLPESMSQLLEINDRVPLETCQLLEQEIQSMRSWDVGTALLRDVARALTHYDWTGILTVTPDFVVYAIDHEFEGHDIEKVLSASASQDQIRDWKAKGWLW